MIEYLDWDSSFFGLKIGKFHVSTLTIEDVDVLLNQKQLQSYDLVYVFVDTPTKESSDYLLVNGGTLVDEKVIYEKSVPKGVHQHLDLINYHGECTEQLINLALASGHSSRFKVDNRLNHKFEEFYTLWMKKSVDKVLADNVFICQKDDKILGFVSIKIKDTMGQIGLIAVDEQQRGKGIGRALIAECDMLLMSKQIATHQVVTQKQNFGACALYEKCGFKIKEIQTIFHL